MQDRAIREQDLTQEMIMFTSTSLGSAADIFTGVIPGYC